MEDAHDSPSVVIPDVKNGDLEAAHLVLSQLGVKTNGGWNGEVASGNPVWGSILRNTKNVTLTPFKIQNNIMPNVTGMGARDAVFLLESKGLKVKLNGRGKVTAQSISYGNTIVAGNTCTLTLN